MEQNFETCLYNVVDAAKVQKDEPKKKHTTFRIGGPADYFIMPSNEKELAETIRVCREFSIPIYIVGNGSNLLVGDKGFRGAIIQLYKSMGTFQVEGNQITAQAGCSLAQIANAALDAALTGFEFAAGIPGTLGGAVVMNAGAYGGEMKDVLTSVRVMTEEGEIMELPAEELGLGYRTSIIPEKRYIVLGAVISLTEGKKEEIKAVGKHEYIIEGSTNLDDLNDSLDLNLESEDYDSLGGFIIEKLDRLPKAGDSVSTEEGIRMVVEKLDKNRIETVHLYLPENYREHTSDSLETDD